MWPGFGCLDFADAIIHQRESQKDRLLVIRELNRDLKVDHFVFVVVMRCKSRESPFYLVDRLNVHVAGMRGSVHGGGSFIEFFHIGVTVDLLVSRAWDKKDESIRRRGAEMVAIFGLDGETQGVEPGRDFLIAKVVPFLVHLEQTK